jgi:hypothetical protein
VTVFDTDWILIPTAHSDAVEANPARAGHALTAVEEDQ